MTAINVHIGEVKIAKKGELLQAILGSCVGIGIIWKKNRICGLAHCLLPSNDVPTFNIGGRFVTQAIPSLIALMKIKPENIEEIAAVVAGGGNMTNPGASDPTDLVGSKNFETAILELGKLGIRIVHSESGGEEGRKIFVSSLDFSFRVEKIPRIAEVA